MTAKASSLFFSDNITSSAQNETVFWVKKPVSNSSREIRDNILIEHFGFTESDITELDKIKPPFYIFDDSVKDKPASVDHVRKWQTNANGEVPIPIPNDRVQSLIAFREQRALFEVFKVGTFIVDPAIRTEVTENLEKILTATGDKRIAALNNLMVTIEGSGVSRYEIHRAIRFLTNEAGYKNNPFLLIARARTTIYKSDTLSMGSNAFEQSMVTDAIKATNESLYNPSVKTPLTKITNLEAAQINFWASELYVKSNSEWQANQRRWIERFLKMSDEERNSYSEGDVVDLIPPGIRGMGVPSKNEEQLDNLLERRAQEVLKDKAIDIGKRIVEPTDPRSTDRTELLTPTKPVLDEKTSAYPSQVKKDAYPPQQKHPKQFVGRMDYERGNKITIGRTNVSGGGAGLVLEYLKWQTFHQRMAELTKYLVEKDRIERQIRIERTRFVPPRPDIVKEYVKDFQRHGRITVNTLEQRIIVRRLRDLESLLEESYAFYK